MTTIDTFKISTSSGSSVFKWIFLAHGYDYVLLMRSSEQYLRGLSSPVLPGSWISNGVVVAGEDEAPDSSVS